MTQASDKSEIATAYNRWADTYDTDFNRTRTLAAKVLRKAGLQIGGNEVVEVGCGTGYNTEWLAKEAGSILALDFSEGMLLRAKARLNDPRVRFIQHDIRSPWPIPDASADLLIAMLVLEHVEHLDPFFGEAARTLKTGAELFLCELHSKRQLMGKQAQFTDSKTGRLHRVQAFLHEIEHYVNAALSSGFEIIRQADWHDADAQPDALPRLLSLRLRLAK